MTATQHIGVLTAWGQRDSHAVTLASGESNRSPRAGTPYRRITWQGILDLAKAPAGVDKANAQFFIGSTYAECDGRTHDVQRAQGSFHALPTDIDKGNPDLDQLAQAVRRVYGDVEALFYSSSGARPDLQKWRAIVPLAEPISGYDYSDTQAAAFALLTDQRIIPDTTLDRAAQPVFLPNVPPEKRGPDGAPLFYKTLHHTGPRLRLTPSHPIVIKREAQRIEAQRATAKSKEKADRLRAEKLAHVAATGDDFDPIPHFNANHNLADILARYGFEHKGRDSWTSPLSESGSASTKNYGDYWVTVSAWAANHGVGHRTGTGAHKGDAFDLFAYFEHGGDISAAVRAYAKEVRPDPPPRDPNGRFTGAGLQTFAGDAPKGAKPLPLRDARMKTAKDVQSALDMCAAWDGESPAPVVAVASDPGLGKSRAMRELLARPENLNRLTGDAHFYTPSLSLADEAAEHAQSLNLTHAVTRGRLARNPETDKPMCDRPTEAERVGKLGQPVKPTLCIAKDDLGMERACPFYDGCAHRRQFLNLPEGNIIRFEALPYLNLKDAAEGRNVGLRVIDETFWKAMGREATITLDALLAPRSEGKCKKETDKAERASVIADLIECAGTIAAALRQGQPIMQAVAAYTPEDMKAYAEAENWSAHRLPFFPDADPKAIEQSLKASEAHNAQAGAKAQFWTNLRKAMDGDIEDLQNILFLPNHKPKKTSDPRDVVKVFWHVEPPRDVPVILLDADADSTLIEPFFPAPDMRKTQVLPNADITYIIDKTFSKTALLKKPARDEWRNVIAVERMKDEGGGVLAIATKKVVAAFFTDAGYDLTKMEDKEATAFMTQTPLHGVRWAWFGPMTLGSNMWKDCTTCIVMGREEWPVAALEAEARKIWGHGLELVQPDEKGNVLLPSVAVPFPMADGTVFSVDVWAHPDPRVRAIQAQARECATRQGVERLRLASAATPKRVIIGSRVPIQGLPATRAITWADYTPTREAAALAEAEGALRISGKGLAADAPNAFQSEKAAQRYAERVDLAERLFDPHTLNISIINGMGGKNRVLVAFRIKGVRGSKKTRAILTCAAADAHHIASMKWGDLLEFEVLREATPQPMLQEQQDERAAQAERIAIIQESEGVEYAAAAQIAGIPPRFVIDTGPPNTAPPFRIANNTGDPPDVRPATARASP